MNERVTRLIELQVRIFGRIGGYQCLCAAKSTLSAYPFTADGTYRTFPHIPNFLTPSHFRFDRPFREVDEREHDTKATTRYNEGGW